MAENKYLIISGGDINHNNLLEYMNNIQYDHIIAVDKGVEVAYQLGIKADYIVGDFDTVNSDILEEYKNNISNTDNIRSYQPEKDYTDTHIAVLLAIENKADMISIFGATGGRLDHLFANISMLLTTLKADIYAEIIDDCNKIYMTDKNVVIHKDKQYGKYISLISYEKEVVGVTLTGFKYPLNNYHLYNTESIGISNEIIESKALVKFTEGKLLIIESKDK